MAGDQYLPRVESTFSIVLRGYDRAQVAEHLRLVNAELRMIAADRDAAVDQASQLAYRLDAARTDSERLREQLTRMAEPPETVDGMSERLQWMLRLAHEETKEMRAAAEAEADETRAASVAEAAELTERNNRQAAELEAEKARVRDEIQRQVSAATVGVQRMHAEAERERAALDAHAEARRGEAEQDFTIALAAKRAAAEADFEDLEARRRAEAARIIDEASADARRLIAEAEEKARRALAEARERIAELRVMRERITAQLGTATAGLDRVLGELGPLPEEESLEAEETAAARSAEPAGDVHASMNALS
jgi:cell division septum initiation protein DivIVA